jgi:sec-independent protein translocase protein TatA
MGTTDFRGGTRVPSFIGVPELLIVLLIVLVIFGPKKLPQLGRSLGSGMREFKDSVTGKNKDDEPEVIEGPERSNVTTAAAAEDEETETARRRQDAKTADAS